MGKDATASLSYGFIIPQSKVLKLLQKLQNSTEKVTSFDGWRDAHRLEELLTEHLGEKGITLDQSGGGEETFELVFLTADEDTFEGLAILYNGIDGETVMVWGFGAQQFEPLTSPPWDQETEHADAAFKGLSQVPLFQELQIVVVPRWLLGCNMTY